MRKSLSIPSLLALLILTSPLFGQDPDRLLEHAEKRFLRGLYSSALKKFQKAAELYTEDLAQAGDADGALLKRKRFKARWGEGRTQRMTGQYGPCVDLIAQLLKEENGEDVRRKLDAYRGGVLLETGKPAEALKIFEAVIEEEDENLRARLGKGQALLALGKKNEAFEAFEWFVDYWAMREAPPTSEVLETVALSAIALGVREQDLYLDAQRLLERCEKEFPENQDARVALANLYVERYATAQANPVLKSLFKTNPNHPAGRASNAVLLMKRWKNKEAGEECDRALKVNPNLPSALIAKGSLLIADQNYKSAEIHLRKAIEVNPVHVEAMSFLAGCLYMRGDMKGYGEIEKMAMELRPDYGAFHLTIGSFVSLRRRLAESLDHYRKAIQIDPELWAAHFALGMSLSRMGRHGEAKKVLERGYNGDKYNVQVYNLLKLFDAYENHFVEKKTPHFLLVFHKSEADVMSMYCGRLLEESWDKLTKKYGFTPGVPVYSEMFSLHADFAVRTMGFPGLGALGACFGPLITLDSP
ncbi:MAG: tetratricopeptide repeat protein, partial [Planctomycetota bacterium]